MDIALLSKMISQLILDRDEVALPGMGTFVAEIMPASFSDKGFTINPPYRRLSFYGWKSEDNSLVELYAKSNGISSERAQAYVSSFVLELKEALMQRKTVVFPGLGKMRVTRDNKFFFISNEDLDIFPEGVGLEPVSLKNNDSGIDAGWNVPAFENYSDVPEENPEPAPQDESVQKQPDGTETELLEQQAELQQDVQQSAELVSGEQEKTKPKRRRGGKFWKTLLVLVVIAGLALGVFCILARVAPDFIDSILYTPEELEILRW